MECFKNDDVTDDEIPLVKSVLEYLDRSRAAAPVGEAPERGDDAWRLAREGVA